MKYKVGDKVRVRKDLVIDSSYGREDFVSEMKQFVGKIVTISKMIDEEYMILEDDGDYAWTEEMFEGLANKAPSITKRINDKHNILNGLLNSDGSVDGEKLMEKLESQSDSAVKHPSHYTQGIECYKYINSHNFNFNAGCIIKYATRYLLKGKPIEDLRKVQQYAEYEIERLKALGYKE